MCLICVEFEKEKLTIPEARRNLGEMSVDLGEHAEEVELMLREKEMEILYRGYLEYDDYECWHGNGD